MSATVTPDASRSGEPLEGREPLLCAMCEYDLRNLPAEGNCPECGFSVDESMRAVGRWSLQRVSFLRWACACLSCLGPSFLVLTVLTRGPATSAARMIVTIALGVYVCALVAAVFMGLHAASRQPSNRRRFMLIAMSVVILGIAIPILATTSGLTNAVQANIVRLLTVASVLRLLLTMFGLHFLIVGLRDLRPRWKLSRRLTWLTLVVTPIPWSFIGAALLTTPWMQWPSPRGLDIAAGIALFTESGLMCAVTVVAVGLFSSLGRNRLVER